MTQPAPLLIAHATDRFDGTDPGFVHAVALAVAHGSGAELVTLHVTQGAGQAASAPQAAPLLEQWGHVRQAFPQRLYECPGHDEIPDELIAACESLRPALIIMPTHARTGLTRLLAGSIAEAVARNLRVPSLLLPMGGDGLVDPGSGALALDKMLVLGGSNLEAQLGVDAAAWFARTAARPRASLTVLHINDGTPCPAPRAPQGMQMDVERRSGGFEAAVAAVAAARNAQLIVMVSHGHDGVGDVLWSSHTERVLHVAGRPLLWVPPNWSVPSSGA